MAAVPRDGSPSETLLGRDACVGCLGRLTRLTRYRFAPGMSACFADYFGMALLTPALPYFLADDVGLDERGVSVWTGAITTAQYAGGEDAENASKDGARSRRAASLVRARRCLWPPQMCNRA